MLDNNWLRAEISIVHRSLTAVATGPRGEGFVDDIARDMADISLAAILWQALFADCLRVVYSAAFADGKLDDSEVDALYEFVFSVARSYAGVRPETYGDFAALSDDGATHAFLERYASDRGPFGRLATLRWPGLALCARAAERGEPEALERYEPMMTWLRSEACRIGGITETDSRWRGRVDELDELRRTLAEYGAARRAKPDRRIAAFLGSRDAFSAVQLASSVSETDPFDVPSIHADARAAFEDLVERACSPDQNQGRGRILLVRGASGSGKTHLLRAYRRYVHEGALGFVTYAQLHTRHEDYAQYLLQHVVNGLTRPYSKLSQDRIGLHELASGLLRIANDPLRAKLELLLEDDWDGPLPLADYVRQMADELQRDSELAKLSPSLVRVMLYALRPDPRTTARVYQYLRCEPMLKHDRDWLGGVPENTANARAYEMICDLARLAAMTQQRAFVLMVDQAELAAHESAVTEGIGRAVDTLIRIASEVPSVVVVVACLTDLYVLVRRGLNSPTLDRLEHDPPAEDLAINRSYLEIEALVGRRLEWLFGEEDTLFRAEDPTFPIPPTHLRRLENRRTRDILEWCQRYQERCRRAGKILDIEASESSDLPVDFIIEESVESRTLGRIAAMWNDAVHAPSIVVPDEDEDIIALLAHAADACAVEERLTLASPPKRNGLLRIQLSSAADQVDLVIGVTNRSYQRGAFPGQIEKLRKRAGKTSTPVAVRTQEFPRGAVCDAALGQLIKSGGRKVLLDTEALRTLAAFQSFQPDAPPELVAEWRRRDRPISSLGAIAELFDLERLRAAPDTAPGQDAAAPPPVAPRAEEVEPAKPEPRPAPPTAETVPPRASSINGVAAPPNTTIPTEPPTAAKPERLPAAAVPPPPVPASPLALGVSTSFQAEPRELELASLLRHTGILGSSGSGKTTLALNLIEQVLERDVAVILIDRKGDLAGYAKPDWWKHTSNPARARKLADRIDVRLFTPGSRRGRPLALSVIPDLAEIPEHEHERMVSYSTQALAAMMRLGDGANGAARRAILAQAIWVLAERGRPSGLEDLITLLADRDEALLARTGRLNDKQFEKLVQDLETVRLSDADLFDPSAEPLTASTLLGRGPDGRTPLVIASTRFLGDPARIQSWTAHLIACLNRHVAQHPHSALNTLLMIDEADVFMPAGAVKPPSKEPLQDLLKRARSAGLGIVLASQSPADFDYRSREQINTWFLGRIGDRRSIDKMRPLFEQKPFVGNKLPLLERGRFVLLHEGNALDLERTPSLLYTDQISEADLMALAAATRPAA